MRNILITGGAGFIGSHLVKHFVKKYKNYNIINVDKLTYASNVHFLKEINNFKNYTFVQADICNLNEIEEIFKNNKISSVIHLAAESHVDNSIENALEFAKTNVLGTINLLEVSRKNWTNSSNNLFYHISTDEVFGSLNENGIFNENSNYDPHSPYSASKASADHFVRAFYDTHKLPVIISNCSNNYGPFQFPEKLIPLCLLNILRGKELPIYGDGKQTRSFCYVDDLIDGIFRLLMSDLPGPVNIGNPEEWTVLDMAQRIRELLGSEVEVVFKEIGG